MGADTCIVCGTGLASPDDYRVYKGKDIARLKSVLGDFQSCLKITTLCLCNTCCSRLEKIEELLSIHQGFIEDFKRTNSNIISQAQQDVRENVHTRYLSKRGRAWKKERCMSGKPHLPHTSQEQTEDATHVNKDSTKIKLNGKIPRKDGVSANIINMAIEKDCKRNIQERNGKILSSSNKNPRTMFTRSMYQDNDPNHSSINTVKNSANKARVTGIDKIERSTESMGMGDNNRTTDTVINEIDVAECVQKVPFVQKNEDSGKSERAPEILSDKHRNINDEKPTKDFKCQYCAGVFSTFRIRKEHQLKFHQNEVSKKAFLKCPYCEKKYQTAASLDRHSAKEHADKSSTYQCGDCEAVFALLVPYRKHCREHKIQNEIFTCRICNKAFKKKFLLHCHEESHKTEKEIKCGDCGKMFKGKMNLRTHMYTVHSQTYNQTQRSGPLLCDYCGKAFKVRRCLLAHIRCHTGVNTHKCEHCDAVFPNLSRLKIHIDVSHLKAPRYECNICKKTFIHNISYKNHIKMHSDIRPYLCSTCGKGFRTNPHLKEHMNIHTQEKTFECNLCGEKFLWRAQLLKHKKEPHNSDGTKALSKSTLEKQTLKKSHEVHIPVENTLLLQENSLQIPNLLPTNAQNAISSTPSINSQHFNIHANMSLHNAEIPPTVSYSDHNTIQTHVEQIHNFLDSDNQNIDNIPKLNTENHNMDLLTSSTQSSLLAANQEINHLPGSSNTAEITIPLIEGSTESTAKPLFNTDGITQSDQQVTEAVHPLTYITLSSGEMVPSQTLTLAQTMQSQSEIANCGYILYNVVPTPQESTKIQTCSLSEEPIPHLNLSKR